MLLLDRICASDSSSSSGHLLATQMEEILTNAKELLDKWKQEGLTELAPLDKEKIAIFTGKDVAPEASAVKIGNPISKIRFLSGEEMQFVYINGNYYVKYDVKIFVFPENYIDEPVLFIDQLGDIYCVKLQNYDNKMLEFILICPPFKPSDDKSLEESENDEINTHLTLAEQGFMPAQYILPQTYSICGNYMPESVIEVIEFEDFNYLALFYFRNILLLKRYMMDSPDHFMRLINERCYTDEKKMPALFPFIFASDAIILLRQDPDFFLSHVDQFFANEALRRQLPYINIYKILNNTETDTEEKIRLLNEIG